MLRDFAAAPPFARGHTLRIPARMCYTVINTIRIIAQTQEKGELNMKKTVCILLSLLMILSSIAALAAVKDNGVWQYEITNGKVKLVAYNGTDKLKKLEFPAEIEDCPVTVIGDGMYFVWLSHVGQRTELVFPETVETIVGPFFTIGYFGTVTIPASVKEIAAEAFSISSVSEFKFAGAPEIYGANAFSENDDLKSIVIPEGALTMGESCFEKCDRLTSAVLPASLERIGAKLFNGCVRLTSIEIPKNCAIKEIPMGCFMSCPIKSIVLPGKVESIGSNAFYACEKLTSVTIPAGVTKIASDAFSGCPSGLTLTVTEDSYAQQWADEHGFKTKVVPAPVQLPEGAADAYTELKPGCKGQEVLDARTKLYELGYFKNVPTQTEYTTNMMDYVRKFEADYGLETDGILSPEDLALLYAL